MNEKNEPLNYEEENDLRKRRFRVSTDEDSIHRFSSATAELCGGVAEAISKAFRRFGDEITAENATRIGVSNGFITGTVAAHSDFLRELSATTDKVYDTIKNGPQRDADLESIDYDRLAKLVVAEMLKAEIFMPVAEVKVEVKDSDKTTGKHKSA
jgi:hypothetical protein